MVTSGISVHPRQALVRLSPRLATAASSNRPAACQSAVPFLSKRSDLRYCRSAVPNAPGSRPPASLLYASCDQTSPYAIRYLRQLALVTRATLPANADVG